MFDGAPPCATCENKPVEPHEGNKKALSIFYTLLDNRSVDIQSLQCISSMFSGISEFDLEKVITVLIPAYVSEVNTNTKQSIKV